MTDYEELSGLMGSLYVAAIDAYMKQNGWERRSDAYWKEFTERPDLSWQPIGVYPGTVSGSHLDASGYRPVKHSVTCPSSTGQGGGTHIAHWVNYGDMSDSDFSATFHGIRENIDSLLNDCLELPNPASFGSVLGDLRNSVDIELAITGNGPYESSGPLAGYLDVLNQNAAHLMGLSFDALRTDFLSQVPSKILNFHGITVAIAAGLNAESELWDRTRTDVVSGFDQLLDGLQAYAASRPQPNWKLQLTVIGAVEFGVAALGVIFPEVEIPCLITESLLSSMSGAIHEKKGAAEVDVPVSDFDTVMAAAKQHFGSLAKNVLEEELSLNDAIVAADSFLYDNRSLVVLQFGADVPSDPNHTDLDHLPHTPKIAIWETAAEDLYKNDLPLVANALLGVKKQLIQDNIMSSSPWNRPDSIGMGYIGCFHNWSELVWHLDALIGNLAGKVNDAAYLLKTIVDGFDNHDTNLGQQWNNVIRDANLGYPNTVKFDSNGQTIYA